VPIWTRQRVGQDGSPPHLEGDHPDLDCVLPRRALLPSSGRKPGLGSDDEQDHDDDDEDDESGDGDRTGVHGCLQRLRGIDKRRPLDEEWRFGERLNGIFPFPTFR
jgi:hypothetical protein